MDRKKWLHVVSAGGRKRKRCLCLILLLTVVFGVSVRHNVIKRHAVAPCVFQVKACGNSRCDDGSTRQDPDTQKTGRTAEVRVAVCAVLAQKHVGALDVAAQWGRARQRPPTTNTHTHARSHARTVTHSHARTATRARHTSKKQSEAIVACQFTHKWQNDKDKGVSVETARSTVVRLKGNERCVRRETGMAHLHSPIIQQTYMTLPNDMSRSPSGFFGWYLTHVRCKRAGKQGVCQQASKQASKQASRHTRARTN